MRDAIRHFNKHVLNPLMMTVAGRRHWYAAVIYHTGRRSGKAYATPIVAAEIENGFIVPLPYGTHVDWLLNVLATGGATIRDKGTQYAVIAPEIIDAATALPLVSRPAARTWRRLHMTHFLRVATVTHSPDGFSRREA